MCTPVDHGGQRFRLQSKRLQIPTEALMSGAAASKLSLAALPRQEEPETNTPTPAMTQRAAPPRAEPTGRDTSATMRSRAGDE